MNANSDPSNELGFYMFNQLNAGASSTQLRATLLQAGWPADLVDHTLNRVVAHSFYQLPQPLNWYHSPQIQPLPARRSQAARRTYPLIGSKPGRFITTSLAVWLVISIPVVLVVAWLLIITNWGGSAGFNTVGAFTIVATALWVIAGIFWYARAPFIAIAQPEVSAWKALRLSYGLRTGKSQA